MCVEHIGSNYVGLRQEGESYKSNVRIHFDNFEGHCREEYHWRKHLNNEMAKIQGQMKEIMQKKELNISGYHIVKGYSMRD